MQQMFPLGPNSSNKKQQLRDNMKIPNVGKKKIQIKTIKGSGGGLPGGVEPVLFIFTKQLLSVMMSQFSSVFLASS